MVVLRILNTPALYNVATQRAENQTEFQHQHEVKTINCLSSLGCHGSQQRPQVCLCLTKHTKLFENTVQEVCAFTNAVSQGVQEQTELKFIKEEMDQEESVMR